MTLSVTVARGAAAREGGEDGSVVARERSADLRARCVVSRFKRREALRINRTSPPTEDILQRIYYRGYTTEDIL
jgi:hypothetical protein